jgi:hypothetical protein
VRVGGRLGIRTGERTRDVVRGLIGELGERLQGRAGGDGKVALHGQSEAIEVRAQQRRLPAWRCRRAEANPDLTPSLGRVILPRAPASRSRAAEVVCEREETVSHGTNVVEHPELVAERIGRFAGLVGRERVIASTDCGLGGRVHSQIAWAKVEALGQGAALATRQLRG